MIRFLKEVALPAGLWTYFLVKAVLMGRGIAGRELGLQPDDSLGFGALATVCGFAALLGAVFSFLNTRFQSERLDRLLERIFGPDSFRIMCRRLQPDLMGSAFFLLLAGAGLAKSHLDGPPARNWQVLTALGCLPIGILAAVLARRDAAKRGD